MNLPPSRVRLVTYHQLVCSLGTLSCRAEEEGGSGGAVRPTPTFRELHKRERQLYNEQEAGRRSQAAAEPFK